MELHEKLQQLRKEKGVTQEELAAAIFVSRTAVSKWERGAGVPNIESLKAISAYFGVSVDKLLSSEALLTIAHEESCRKEQKTRRIFVALMDCAMLLLLFLPLFGEKSGDLVRAVPIFSLNVALYIRIPYFIAIIGSILLGILTLALQELEHIWVGKWGEWTSLFLSVALAALLILTLQPYAAFFTLIFFLIKVIVLIKWR